MTANGNDGEDDNMRISKERKKNELLKNELNQKLQYIKFRMHKEKRPRGWMRKVSKRNTYLHRVTDSDASNQNVEKRVTESNTAKAYIDSWNH